MVRNLWESQLPHPRDVLPITPPPSLNFIIQSTFCIARMMPWGVQCQQLPWDLEVTQKAEGVGYGLKRRTRYTGGVPGDTCHAPSPLAAGLGLRASCAYTRAEQRRDHFPITRPQATWTAGPGPCQRLSHPTIICFSTMCGQCCWLDLILSQPPVSLTPLSGEQTQRPLERN